MAPRTTLVILTLNEIEGVRAVFDRIPRDAVDEILVVDGGSTDGTREFFEERGIPVFLQKERGKGVAIVEGAERASGENLVFFSPDGNEDPRDIPRIVEGLNRGYSLVIASRFLPGGATEDSDDRLGIRRLGNRFFTGLVNLLFGGPRLTDVTSGLRGMKRADLLRLRIDTTHFETELQQCARSKKLGYRILEIPAVEGKRVGGARKAHTWLLAVRFTVFLAREWWAGKRFESFK